MSHRTAPVLLLGALLLPTRAPAQLADTRVLTDAAAGGQLNLAMTVPGTAVLTGGIPVAVDGVTVGGIGVSGVTSDQDEEIAKARLAAVFP